LFIGSSEPYPVIAGPRGGGGKKAGGRKITKQGRFNVHVLTTAIINIIIINIITIIIIIIIRKIAKQG
jgi:hypothetical protein